MKACQEVLLLYNSIVRVTIQSQSRYADVKKKTGSIFFIYQR